MGFNKVFNIKLLVLELRQKNFLVKLVLELNSIFGKKTGQSGQLMLESGKTFTVQKKSIT